MTKLSLSLQEFQNLYRLRKHFSYIDEELGIDLTALCRLDTMVTVVDANRFVNDIQSEDLLADRDESIGMLMNAQ